jgi:BirA family transcriptional regulator, biotin operon repressor / biotin---[acetyl-CoA-carboxylase] ligase
MSEAVPSADADAWGRMPLQAHLQLPWPGLQVQVLAQCGSTNALLMARGRAPQAAVPTLLLAEHQTQGRGRLGRRWHAPPGASLTFSLAVPLQRPELQGLSLAVGVALAEALDPGHLGLKVKWPNDLCLRGGAGVQAAWRKLGGILIECARQPDGSAWTVVGVGLNLRALPAPVDAASADLPDLAYLSELHAELAAGETGAPEAAAVAHWHTAARALAQALRDFEQHGFAPFHARYAPRDLLFGLAIRAGSTPELALQGTADGIDPDGALRLRTDQGLQRLHSGEISVRALAAATACAPA